MQKTSLKCDKCGAEMYIDGTKGRAICPDCNFEKTVVNFSLDNEIMKVESFGDPTEMLARAEAYFDMQEYDRASEFFAQAINIDPNDYKGWWGITRCRVINNYLCIDNGYEDAYQKVVKLAPTEVLPELEIKYSVYLEELNKRRAKQQKVVSSSKDREITIKATRGPVKAYNHDYIIAVVLGVLAAVFIVLAITIGKKWMQVFIIGCIMLALGALFIVKNVFDTKKIVRLVTTGECNKITELMTIMKRKNKYEFIKNIGSMMKAGYLVDYMLVDSEYLIKAESEDDYIQEEIKVKNKKE